jgi:hypothetical protein
MTIDDIAKLVIAACNSENIDYMVTGAFAFNYYGIPRSTNDFDVVVSLAGETPMGTFKGLRTRP